MNPNTSSRLSSISARLGLGFAVLVAMFVLCAGFGIWQLNRLGSALESVFEHEAKSSALALKLEAQAFGAAVQLRNAILSDDGKQIKASLDEYEAVAKQRDETKRDLEKAMDSAESHTALKAVQASEAAYLAAVGKAQTAIKSGDSDEARNAISAPENTAAQRAYIAALRALVKQQDMAETSARADSASQQSRSGMLLAAFALVAGVLAAILGATLTRSIVGPTRQAMEAARRITNGDLTRDVLSSRRDELGDMLDTMQLMQLSLRKIVGEVREVSQSIESASGELATGNLDLSTRTEHTASNLQQTASSMVQLRGHVSKSAGAAAQAKQLAASAAQVAQRGGDVVGQVVATMQEINISSKKIADIIGVIDSIAFQTNILALNAAVEAARAGEQGRGFAVVASEVRSLAKRSAEAAKEIKTLIGTSVDRVDAGTRLVGDAGSTMDEIVASVQSVSDIIGEISAATAEQTSDIGQINTSVTDLDKMTQQNAALVEQSAAAAESVKDQAHRLSGVVGQFTL